MNHIPGCFHGFCKHFIFVFMTLSVFICYQQGAYGNDNIEPAKCNFSLFMGLSYFRSPIQISSDNSNLNYQPESTARVDFGFYYRRIGFNFSGNSFSSLGSGTDIDNNTYTNMLINYLTPRMGLEFFLNQYKGYTLKSDPENGIRVDINRPDITSRLYGINIYYVAPLGRFNLDESLSLQTKPEQGGLAPVFLVSPHYFEFDSSGSIIPSEHAQYYGSDAGLSGGKFVNLSALVGPGFSVIEGRSQTTLIALAGPILQHQEYYVYEQTVKRYRIAGRFLFKGRLIIDLDNVFFGFHFHFDYMAIWLKKAELFTPSLAIGVFGGFRL